MTNDEINSRTRMYETNIKAMKADMASLNREQGIFNIRLDVIKKKTQENKDKVKKNMQLPYLVSNIAEVIDPIEEEEESGAVANMNADIKEKSVVIKTTNRRV